MAGFGRPLTVITPSPEKQTVQPLTYEFRCDYLYYPLVVTNLYGGEGVVELFTIFPKGLGNRINSLARGDPNQPPLIAPHTAVAAGRWRMLRMNSISELTAEELAGLHPDLPTHMGADRVSLWACKYEGPLRFEHDVREPLGYAGAEEVAKRFLLALAAGDRYALETLTMTPFALSDATRAMVITEREKLLTELLAIKPRHGAPGLTPKAVGAGGLGLNALHDPFTRDFIAECIRSAEGAYVGLSSILPGAPGGYEFVLRITPHGFGKVAAFRQD